MKIWRKFKPIKEFTAHLDRKCWQICDTCRTKWKDSDTEFVHMIINDGVKYICDNCESKTQENA